MKNITLKVDDATYREARIRAAKEGTSVSAMVRDFLNNLRTLDTINAAAESDQSYHASPVDPLPSDDIYNIRKLDNDTLARLKNRASRHRRSLQQEIESLLLDAARMIPDDEHSALSSKLTLKTVSTGNPKAKWDRQSIYENDGR